MNMQKIMTNTHICGSFIIVGLVTAAHGCVCFVAHLRQPVVLRSSTDDWNLTLCSSRCETLLQPECGMTTVLVSVLRASRMMVIFTASHDERFHRTPGEEKSKFLERFLTSLCLLRKNSLTLQQKINILG